MAFHTSFISGYSQTPLTKKLGLYDRQGAVIINPPLDYIDYLKQQLPSLHITNTVTKNHSFIHYFTDKKEDLEKNFMKLKKSLADDGTLWISWPKLSAETAGDLTEAIVQTIGLTHGLVDVKVIAVDDTWSGLKFVYRLEDRKK